MVKTKQICNRCGSHLKFRKWSNRYPINRKWKEALADCPLGCGKFGIRYFDGKPTCDPYQVKAKAKKTKRGSWKLDPAREASIKSLYGSIQKFLDGAPLVGMPLQSKQ